MSVEPRTKAGQRLLEREAMNSRSFALIRVEDILAIEAEAARLCDRPHRRIATLPPGIPTCIACGWRSPGAQPGDPYPVPDHECDVDD